MDRRAQIERELRRAELPFSRVSAVYGASHNSFHSCWQGEGNHTCAGTVGVKFSQIRALDIAINEGHEATAFFEDDFGWLPHVQASDVVEYVSIIQRSFPNWDVIFLSANLQQSTLMRPSTSILLRNSVCAQVHKVIEAQGAHGYVVSRHYLEVIRRAFDECRVTDGREIAIDQCWKPLQRSANWYILKPMLGTQIPSYSDIELTEVNYGIGVT